MKSKDYAGKPLSAPSLIIKGFPAHWQTAIAALSSLNTLMESTQDGGG